MAGASRRVAQRTRPRPPSTSRRRSWPTSSCRRRQWTDGVCRERVPPKWHYGPHPEPPEQRLARYWRARRRTTSASVGLSRASDPAAIAGSFEAGGLTFVAVVGESDVSPLLRSLALQAVLPGEPDDHPSPQPA